MSRQPEKVRVFAYVWERFGVTAIFLALCLYGGWTFASWARADFAKLEDTRQRDLQEFTAAVHGMTAAMAKAAEAQDKVADRLERLETVLMVRASGHGDKLGTAPARKSTAGHADLRLTASERALDAVAGAVK